MYEAYFADLVDITWRFNFCEIIQITMLNLSIGIKIGFIQHSGNKKNFLNHTECLMILISSYEFTI